MTVIAMTREMGTLGKNVAAGLAETLGLEVIHHELVERHVAERLHASESAVHRFLEGEATMWDRWKIDSKRLSHYSAEEILELAAKGNVIIRGWGAAQLLSDVQHVICVRIHAPMQNRVDEMMQRLGISDRYAVQQEIMRNDDAHTSAIQRQFGMDWRNSASYDVALNSARIPIDACVQQVRLLAEHSAFMETDESRAELQDKLIEARVRTVLDTEIDDVPFGSALKMKVSKGKVTMSGIITDAGNHSLAIEKLHSVTGVTSVQDDVQIAKLQYGV